MPSGVLKQFSFGLQTGQNLRAFFLFFKSRSRPRSPFAQTLTT